MFSNSRVIMLAVVLTMTSVVSAQTKKIAVVEMAGNTLIHNHVNEEETGKVANMAYQQDVRNEIEGSYKTIISEVMKAIPVDFVEVGKGFSNAEYASVKEREESSVIKALSKMDYKIPKLMELLKTDELIGIEGSKVFNLGVDQESAFVFADKMGAEAIATIRVVYNLVAFTSIGGNGTAGIETTVKVTIIGKNRRFDYKFTGRSKSKFKLVANKLAGKSEKVSEMVSEANADLLENGIPESTKSNKKRFEKYLTKM